MLLRIKKWQCLVLWPAIYWWGGVEWKIHSLGQIQPLATGVGLGPCGHAVGWSLVKDWTTVRKIPLKRLEISEWHWQGGCWGRIGLTIPWNIYLPMNITLHYISSAKQNLLLLIQPRWQLRRTYLFNYYNVLLKWICIHRPIQTQNK